MCRHPPYGLPILASFLVLIYLMVVTVAGSVSLFLTTAITDPVVSEAARLLPAGLLRDVFLGPQGLLTFGLFNSLTTVLEGECCRASASWVQKVVIPLTELAVEHSARVAWVYARSDRQLHSLDSLQIRPGSMITLHQRSPSWVIKCDGASIALDGEVGRTINVWLGGGSSPSAQRFAGETRPERQAPPERGAEPRWGTGPGRGPERRRGDRRRLLGKENA